MDKPLPPLSSTEAGQLVVGQRIIGLRPRFGRTWLRPTWDGLEHRFEAEDGVEILLANGTVLHTIGAPVFVDRPEPLKPGDDQTKRFFGLDPGSRDRTVTFRNGSTLEVTPSPVGHVQVRGPEDVQALSPEDKTSAERGPFWGRWWEGR